MILIFATAEEVATLLAAPERRQTSGMCVHYDPDGAYYSPQDGEHQDEAPVCAYPIERGSLCPHLDNPEVLCPVKDTLYAMRDLARLREACECEQAEQDAEMVAETVPRSDYVPAPREPPVAADEPDVAPGDDPAPVQAEGRRTPRGRCWTSEEDTVLRTAASAVSAQVAYQESFPDSGRTPAAVSSRWYKVRSPAPTPTPDFAGDVVPVTQYEETDPDEADPDQMVGPEPATGKGIYGDARALHADMMDGAMCDRPLSPEPEGTQDREQTLHPWLGMRVRVLDPLDLANRTGTVVQYNLDPREMLVALDASLDRVWLPPESLLLIGVGRGEA